MSQPRRHSLLESCLNTASGFLVSYLAWPIVCRFVLHVPFHTGSGLEVIAVFTVLSIARNYAWRRAFNRRRDDKGITLHCDTPLGPSIGCLCIEPDARRCAAEYWRLRADRRMRPLIDDRFTRPCLCPCHERRPAKPPPRKP